jgi:hypothetical protein
MKCLTNQSGDTLVEVIFALIILTALLVSSISLARLANIQGNNSRIRTQHANILHEQYEAVRAFRDSVDWDEFLAGPKSGKIGVRFGRDWGGVNRAIPPCHVVPNPPAPPTNEFYCFHMERDGRVGSPTFGKWLPCPGIFHPSFEEDNWVQSGPAPDGDFDWCLHPNDINVMQRAVAVYISTDDPHPLAPLGDNKCVKYFNPNQLNNVDNPRKEAYPLTIIGDSTQSGISEYAGGIESSWIANIKNFTNNYVAPSC